MPVSNACPPARAPPAPCTGFRQQCEGTRDRWARLVSRAMEGAAGFPWLLAEHGRLTRPCLGAPWLRDPPNQFSKHKASERLLMGLVNDLPRSHSDIGFCVAQRRTPGLPHTAPRGPRPNTELCSSSQGLCGLCKTRLPKSKQNKTFLLWLRTR